MFKKTIILASLICSVWLGTLVGNYYFHYFSRRLLKDPECLALVNQPPPPPHPQPVPPDCLTSWPGPSFFYTFSILTIGLMSFVGFLNISRELRGKRGSLQDGDVRFAIACTILIVYLTMLSFFAFTLDNPPPGAKPFLDALLTTTAVVVGFYFATTGAIEVAKIRKGRSEQDGDAAKTTPSEQSGERE